MCVQNCHSYAEMRSHQFRPNIGQGQMRYEHFKTKCLNSNESTRPRSNRASLLRQSLSRQRDTKPATRAEDQRALTKRPAGRPVGATGTIMMRQQQRVDTIRNDVMETTIRTTCLQCSSNEELDAFSSACSMLTSMITANCNYQPVQCQSMMSTMKAETLPNSPERTGEYFRFVNFV